MPRTFEIRHDSLEYLPVRVEGERDGDVYDPTNDVVKIACPVIDVDPVTLDWKTAAWNTVEDSAGHSDYFARILVGPGGTVTLVEGDYDVLVKVTDNPEVPVLRAGLLRIT